MKSTFVLTALVATATFATTTFRATAHHGRDFLVVEDALLPQPGAVHAQLNFEWERTGSASEFGLEPGVLLGVTPYLALGLETSFRDEGTTGWDYASVRPNLHLILTPESAKLPFRAAMGIGYQFAQGAPAEHQEEATADPDHEAEEHHEFSGIHNHTDDLLSVKLVLQTNLTDSTILVGNLIAILPDGDSLHWGYALGLRQTISSGWSVGAEAIGDFATEGWQELAAAVYYEPTCHLTLKLGLGFGLTDNTPDFLLRAGLNYRF